MTEEKENISKLRKLRNGKKLILSDVASECDCSVSMLSEIEKGNKTPSPKLAERISDFYGGKITPAELVFGG